MLIRCNRPTFFPPQVFFFFLSVALWEPVLIRQLKNKFTFPFSISLWNIPLSLTLYGIADSCHTQATVPIHIAHSGRQKSNRQEFEQGQWSLCFLMFIVKEKFLNFNLVTTTFFSLLISQTERQG